MTALELEQQQAAAIDQAAAALLEALAKIESACGADIAAKTCAAMAGLATAYLAQHAGPSAARQTLTSAWEHLDLAVANENGGSSALN